MGKMKFVLTCILIFSVTGSWTETLNTGSMYGYFTYEEITNQLNQLAQNFTGLATYEKFNNLTSDGNLIRYLKIYSLDGLDISERAATLITASQFGGYPIGTSQALYVAKSLLNNFGISAKETRILRNSVVYIIPVINVDAYIKTENSYSNTNGTFKEFLKNSNVAGCVTSENDGINLNRNWGYM